MKIAAITDDGKTISQHFGRAPYYLVLTIENGEIIERELRDKLGHSQFASHSHGPEEPGQLHGMGAASQSKHQMMSQAIEDCQVLLCGGMGMGAYQSMAERNIKPIVTDIKDIERAAMAYIDGSITDQVDRLH